MTNLENDIHAIGYVRCPNVGNRWYAGGAGILEPNEGLDVEVLGDRIRVYSRKFFGEAYTRCSHWDTVTVAMFDSVPSFVAWCKENGRESLPGMPAYMYGD